MKLFELKNDIKKLRTEIKILGIKLKFRNSKLFQYPDYSFALTKIRKKHRNNQKIRVGFLVSESSKWNAEELYNLLEKSDAFEPVILLTLLESVHQGIDNTRNKLNEYYDFFIEQGKCVVKVYDEKTREYLDLENFDVDILFYQQPWELPEIHQPNYVSEYAITCYFPYGLDIFDLKLVNIDFHEYLHTYFIPNEEISLLRQKYRTADVHNEKIVGFPKLDIYRNLQREPELDKKTIIYAPHFSYDKKNLLSIGTFDKFGTKILEFAKHHSEFNWIFKPHPALKKTLIEDKNFGEGFSNEYFSEWEKVGCVFDSGNYFEHFMNSDLLITDASSFLLEYLPTEQPIIRLVPKPERAKLNPFGSFLSSAWYKADSFELFEKLFGEIFLLNDDFLSDTRKNITNCFFDLKSSSSEKIMNYLVNILGKEK